TSNAQRDTEVSRAVSEVLGAARRASLPAPCTVLTTADARGLLGLDATRDAAAPDVDGALDCEYATTARPQLLILPETSNLARFPLPGPGAPAPVTGIGERAALSQGDAPGSLTLYVVQHGVMVALLYSDLGAASAATTAAKVGALESLGQQIAAR